MQHPVSTAERLQQQRRRQLAPHAPIERWRYTDRRGHVCLITRIDVYADRSILILWPHDLLLPVEYEISRTEATRLMYRFYVSLINAGWAAERRL
jgi:hypothetical protein